MGAFMLSQSAPARIPKLNGAAIACANDSTATMLPALHPPERANLLRLGSRQGFINRWRKTPGSISGDAGLSANEVQLLTARSSES